MFCFNVPLINSLSAKKKESMTSTRARVAQWVRSLDRTTHTSLSPMRRGFAPGFVNYKKVCTQLAGASDKVYQLLAHGRWFSPGSSTTKTGRHDIAEILLKVALKHQKSINPKVQTYFNRCHWIIIHNCISLFIVYVKKRGFFSIILVIRFYCHL